MYTPTKPQQSIAEIDSQIETIRQDYINKAKLIVEKIKSSKKIQQLPPKMMEYVHLYEQGLIPTEYFIYAIGQLLRENHL